MTKKPQVVLTWEQFEICFLIVTGSWNARPLSRIVGVYLGYDVSITPAEWDRLHGLPIAIEMAKKALEK